MTEKQLDALDNHITGHYGEDQFREPPDEPDDSPLDAFLEDEEDAWNHYKGDGTAPVNPDELTEMPW